MSIKLIFLDCTHLQTYLKCMFPFLALSFFFIFRFVYIPIIYVIFIILLKPETTRDSQDHARVRLNEIIYNRVNQSNNNSMNDRTRREMIMAISWWQDIDNFIEIIVMLRSTDYWRIRIEIASFICVYAVIFDSSWTSKNSWKNSNFKSKDTW